MTIAEREAKRSMTVWLFISDSDAGTNAVAFATARAAYEWFFTAIKGYLDDDGAYAPHDALRTTLRAAIDAEDWTAFESAIQATENESPFGIDCLYVTKQEMQLP